MGEAGPWQEVASRRTFDEPFRPQSADELRTALDKAGMLTAQEGPRGKKVLQYSDGLITRLLDEFTNKQRSFFRTRYEGSPQIMVESGMNTFRGKIYHRPAGGGELYMVQCAGDVPVAEIQNLGILNPQKLPPRFILKRDSSTSGKLLIDGSDDPEAALYRETQKQLGLSRADFRPLRPPEGGQDESISFLFPKLRTRFQNITYFLEMLASGFKEQYVMRGKQKEIEGVDHYPVTVSTWIPAE